MTSDSMIAAVDAGGTSFKCALVRGDGERLAAWRIPTTTPQETLEACAEAFQREATARNLDLTALGIASFGPVDIDPASARYGTITGTAKPGWHGAPIGPALAKALQIPFHLDTDVNAALAAERRWGAARGFAGAAYMTVGTGIGVGLYLNGASIGRPAHPEFGHIRVARHADDQTFPGTCTLHGDCLEGLASARAVQARWSDPKHLESDHPGWDVEAFYLAQACTNLYLMSRLDRIVIGGGLLQARHLYGKIQAQFDVLMGDYLPVKGAELIAPPELGEHAGVLGGAVIALEALN
ncbi:MAG: ROK family protein [Henriciella sp.]